MTAREAFEKLLCTVGVVVVVDATGFPRPVLPAHLMDSAKVVLMYELDPAGVPIPDLDIGDDGVRATLSFDRTPFKTFVPWGCIRAMRGIHAEAPEAVQRRHLKAV